MRSERFAIDTTHEAFTLAALGPRRIQASELAYQQDAQLPGYSIPLSIRPTMSSPG